MKPKEFFERLLPEAWSATDLQQVPGWSELEADLLYEVAGPDGGRWHLSLSEGSLSVEHGCKHPPLVQICQSYDAWQQGLPKGSMEERVRARMRPSIWRAHPHKIALLRRLRGALSVHLQSSGAGAVASTRIEINPPADDGPSFELYLDLEDYHRLQREELTVEEAFLAGQIRLEGDADFAMQLAAVVLSS